LGVERHLQSITSLVGLNDIHRLGSFLLPRTKEFKAADVVHFHCTHSGAFSYLALPYITARKPCVFSLCDMWAVTGHCAVIFDCERWKTGCGSCHYLDSNPPVRRDATKWEWRLKERAFRRSPITLVAKCQWMLDQLRESFLANHRTELIPNSVDLSTFRPLAQAIAREFLGIEPDRQVLLTAALNLDDRCKGSDLLIDALGALPSQVKDRTSLLTVGKLRRRVDRIAGIRSRNLGLLADEHFMAIAYSAADLLVLPARSDMLSKVALESIACGTPVVSFKVGGLPEVVHPGETGALAEPEDTQGFRNAIVGLLEDGDLRSRMRVDCRTRAESEFSLDECVDSHIRLYASVAGLTLA